jgi:Flp pilus assembly protein TadD
VARAHVLTALQLAPHYLAAGLEVGGVTRGAEAVRVVARAAAGRRHGPQAELALASARLRAGNVQAAEPVLRAIVKREPKNGVALAQHGAALTALGHFEEAEAQLRAALALIPNDYDTALALAQLYERTERHEEAFTQYRNAADLKREDPEALIAAAQLGMRLDRPMLSGALLDKARERAPRSAKALSLYGDALVARGEKQRARELYKRALAGEGPIDRAAVQKRLEQTK